MIDDTTVERLVDHFMDRLDDVTNVANRRCDVLTAIIKTHTHQQLCQLSQGWEIPADNLTKYLERSNA